MRMVQEIFTNIAKHSHARHVFFSVGAHHLEVRDDGQGFDMATTRSGRGLPHLYRRAQQLGITLTITSSSSGTTLHLTW
jgi:signal transduction histidine kinase